MYITRVELENIKSHVASAFDFERGKTAITGANGAGKTTIIEAIAWALFDVLDYRKEDFVRRGAKRGSVRVTFESGLDERSYVVYRDTGTAYNVYDPRLKTKIADKREEVSRFLWQHLGVEPGTDLDSLFRRAIGVPQGTFTAIFLETPAERKKAFDKLLKVEEYRRGAEELLKTARFVDQQTAAVREKIARFEGEMARFDTIEEEHKAIADQIGRLAGELEEATHKASGVRTTVADLDRSEAELREAKSKVENDRNELANREFEVKQKEIELTSAREAAVKLSNAKADFEKHNAAILRLRELERERTKRDELRNYVVQVETAIAAVKTDQKYTREHLEQIVKAHATVSELRSKAEKQDRLESDIGRLRDTFARSKALAGQITALNTRIERLREGYKEMQTRRDSFVERAAKADGRPALEKRDKEIVRELASINAELERDERFQREIKNGLCPVLSQKCLNLKEGETLEGFVNSKFTELRAQIATLEAEHKETTRELDASREAEKFRIQLDVLDSRLKEITEEGKRLANEKTSLRSQIDALPNIEAELAAAETALKDLENPKAKIQLLTRELERERELRQKVTEIESNLERLESDRRIHVEQLEMYKDLDSQWTDQTRTRDATAEANRVYLTNEELASTVTDREAALKAVREETGTIEKRLKDSQERLKSVEGNYDVERHAVEKHTLLELEKRLVELNATVEVSRRRENELKSELKRLEKIRTSIKSEFVERERLENVAELTTFVRDTLKEAAPLVARNYVYHVSTEANQLFREITGNAEHTLKWGEDYAISLEEGGYERPFGNFSGGEQMAAAIAVRLALLKQLTDIRIAFFDEPTTNMDAERRENLAMQLSQIKHFDQLFVISHDDTFEGYVDNIVTVEKGENEAAIEAQASLIG